MKKIFLSTVVAIFMVVGLSAQTSFGVKAGVNFANLNADGEWDGSDSVTGFHVGVFSDIELSDVLIFQPEILYSTQGAHWAEDDEHILNFINVPLMIKFEVAESFYLEAGPQVGFLISAENEDNDDIKDEFKSTDFVLNLGASVDFGENFLVAARYGLGLSDIVEEEYEGMGIDGKTTNIMISLGYRF